MARLTIQVSRTYGRAKAYANIHVDYTVSTSNSDVSVTATKVEVSSKGVAVVDGNMPVTDAMRTQALSALSTALSSMTVKLTYNGQTVFTKSTLSSGTTYNVSGTKSVNKGTSAKSVTAIASVDGKSASATISVAALASYKVKYNANGGDGAPGDQTKYYGINLTLSTGRPTKSGYTFKGWATSTAHAGSGTVDYSYNGATYSSNTAITLYAVWELNYQKPTIENLKVDRCDQNGDLDDEGSYALVSFDWSVFKSVNAQYYGGSSKPYENNSVYSCSVTVGSHTETPTLTGDSGSVSIVVGNDDYDTDTAYNVSVSITDSQQAKDAHTTTITGILTTTFFPMDINADATAIGFFRPAPDNEEGAFFAKNVYAPNLLYNTIDRVGALTGEAPSDVSVPTGGTWKELCHFTLPPGVWLVFIAAQFEADANGSREISLGTSTAAVGTVIRTLRVKACDITGLVTVLTLAAAVYHNTNTTYYLNARQWSGSPLAVSPRYTAIKIGKSTEAVSAV